MISRRCYSSSPTVYFKRQLSLPPSLSSLLPQIADDRSDLSQKAHGPLLPGRFRASMARFGSAHVPCSSHFALCSNALKTYAKMGYLCEGKQLHSRILRLGCCNLQLLQFTLLNLYVNCREFSDAQRVLDEMPVRDVVVWNTVICGVMKSRRTNRGFAHTHMGIFYVRRMLLETVNPDDITFNSLLRACVGFDDLEVGKQLHCLLLKMGFNLNCFVGTALVDFYAKLALIEDARCVFDEVVFRDLVLWNAMLSCYAFNFLGNEALRTFNLMRSIGGEGDEFTYASLLNSFSALGFCEPGKQIHGMIIRLSYDLDVVVSSALVNMYVKNEIINDARKAFDVMTVRNIVSWNTLVAGYGQNGDGKEAMKLLQKMFEGGVKPDELTLTGALTSCAYSSATSEIEQVHAYVIRNGSHVFLSIANSLINAYSKCGYISRAFESFRSIPEPDIVSWTSILTAYALHGLPKKCIEIFKMMLADGKKPDRIVFLGILSACSHGGLISEGLRYFDLMTKDYQILPGLEHYTCIVGLLGRAGLINEAFDVLTTMPYELERNTLGVFLASCKVHGNLELARWAAANLFVLEPNKTVNYSLMSNIYAAAGNWLGVARTRKMMRDRCDSKVPGCSWMEVSGVIHTFVSRDQSHLRVVEVYAVLERLGRLIKEDGGPCDPAGDEFMLDSSCCF